MEGVQLKAASLFFERGCSRMIVKDEDRVKEWKAARYFAPALNLRKRRILELAYFGLMLLQIFQPGQKRGIVRYADTRRQSIDEEPNDLFAAGQICRATGDGNSKE